MQPCSAPHVAIRVECFRLSVTAPTSSSRTAVIQNGNTLLPQSHTQQPQPHIQVTLRNSPEDQFSQKFKKSRLLPGGLTRNHAFGSKCYLWPKLLPKATKQGNSHTVKAMPTATNKTQTLDL